MDDRTLVMVMVNGIGANLTNEEKRAHLIDLHREHLIDQGLHSGNPATREIGHCGQTLQAGPMPFWQKHPFK
jgi:hypothetical protein